MGDDSVPVGIARTVIESDYEPTRFELFCCDLVSEIEGGVIVVPTSQSWDRGRDGRSVGSGTRIALCATLMNSLDNKVRSDLKKLFANGGDFAKVYFCTSHANASEHTLDKCVAEVRAEVGTSIPVEPLNGTQLSRISGRFPNPIRRHYATEIRELLQALTEDDSQESQVRESTIFALAAAAHPSSGAIRDAAYRQIVLRVLAEEPRTLAVVCREASNRLRLASVIPKRVLEQHVGALLQKGLVSSDDGVYAITDAGIEELEDVDAAAAKQLLDGRTRIREAIEEELGFALADQQFSRIWTAIQTRLTAFFYDNGREMVCVIDRFARPGEECGPGESVDLPFFVKELAAAAAAECAQAELAEQMVVAVSDSFL